MMNPFRTFLTVLTGREQVPVVAAGPDGRPGEDGPTTQVPAWDPSSVAHRRRDVPPATTDGARPVPGPTTTRTVETKFDSPAAREIADLVAERDLYRQIGDELAALVRARRGYPRALREWDALR